MLEPCKLQLGKYTQTHTHTHTHTHTQTHTHIFAVYVNDMPERIDSYINLFADDAKLLRRVQKNEDCEALQQDLDKIFEWFYTWEMEFNTIKMQCNGIWEEQEKA